MTCWSVSPSVLSQHTAVVPEERLLNLLQRRLDSSWPCTQQIIPLRAFCVFVQVRGVWWHNQFPVYISVLSESETAYGEKSYVQKSDWLCPWSPVLLVLLVFSKPLPSKMMSELLRHRTICVSLMLDDSVQYNLRNNSRATCGSVVSRCSINTVLELNDF